MPLETQCFSFLFFLVLSGRLFLFLMRALFSLKTFGAIALLAIFSFGWGTTPSFADEIPLQVFVRDGCAHCAAEEAYLTEHHISARLINIYSNDANKALFDTFAQKFSLSKNTPVTLAGDQIFVGYNDAHTGDLIVQTYTSAPKKYTVEDALANSAAIKMGGQGETCGEGTTECKITGSELLKNVEIPFYGTVDLRDASRNTISLVLGLLDGFNPCAMWVLVVFLISLMQIGDRVKMAITAGTFLLAETIMYGFILVAWWKLFDFVGYSAILNIIVGVVAIGGGAFFLYEGFFTDGTCQVTNLEQRKKISGRIADIAKSPLTIATFFGILGLAFSVNIIEFACSAGYPQLFTSILNSADISFPEKVVMLLLYLAAYMLDDVIVFAAALISIDKINITHKYAKYSNIFGGILMLLLGLLMIFKPEYLEL